jgi:hypothetical protein
MIAVITGDIINSRQYDDPGKWLTGLKELLATVSPGPEFWEIYRGDSFQVELADPEEAFSLVMKIKATIRSYKALDTRMAIGIGEKTYSANNITESNGPAFIHSGELLEQLKGKKEALAIRSPWKEWDEEMNASLSLALVIMDQWKPKTAWLASSILRHPGKSQQEIAELLDMQQAGVSQGLNRAHLKELKEWDIQFRKMLKTKIDANTAGKVLVS